MMTMKDYNELRAAQEAAEMMREAIAIQIANCVVEKKDVCKRLLNAYKESCLAVESTTRDVHNCITIEATAQSFEEGE